VRHLTGRPEAPAQAPGARRGRDAAGEQETTVPIRAMTWTTRRAERPGAAARRVAYAVAARADT
jgi:hypothetical protein